jgi:hypothetical protein
MLQRSGRFRLRSGPARLATDFAFPLFIAIDKTEQGLYFPFDNLIR